MAGISEIKNREINGARALNILQQLIRIRTHQPQGDEADAVKYLLSLIGGNERITPRVISHGANRSTLLLHIRGGAERPPVLLMGHLDTIGLESTLRWKHYPYSADFSDGYVFGRGAINKGGVTAMILAAEILSRCGGLPCDVFFAFTADNDEDGLGARALVEGSFLEGIGEVIFVQPTGCMIGIAQKGVAWVRAEVSGHYAHAAFPKQSADVVKLLLEYHRKLNVMLRGEPHPYLGYNTCVITELESKGIARYMLPGSARASLDIRFLPAINEKRILSIINGTAKELNEKYPEAGFEICVDNLRLPCAMDENSPHIKRFEDIYRSLGFKPKKTGIYYLCDTSVVVPSLGIPFAIIGPGEDIYHSNEDEKIALEDIKKMAKLYCNYIVS